MKPLLPLLLATAVLSGGCKPRMHLNYDFGRAYVETLKLQTDLQRTSVADDAYPLYGAEGVDMRTNVEAATSDANTGEAEYEE